MLRQILYTLLLLLMLVSRKVLDGILQISLSLWDSCDSFSLGGVYRWFLNYHSFYFSGWGADESEKGHGECSPLILSKEPPLIVDPLLKYPHHLNSRQPVVDVEVKACFLTQQGVELRMKHAMVRPDQQMTKRFCNFSKFVNLNICVRCLDVQSSKEIYRLGH